MPSFLRDLRHAARTLRRSPGFTLVAVLTIAVGIGANTAVFSLVDGVILRGLPFAEPDRLVRILPDRFTTAAVHDKVQERGRGYEAVGGYTSVTGVTVTGGVEPRRIPASRVTDGLFDVLRVQPALGRRISSADQRPGAEPVVVLAHSLWLERFAGDAAALGERLTIDGVEHTVVGVMPAEFHFPTRDVRLWLPSIVDRALVGNYWGGTIYHLIGRLRPAAGLDAARTEIRGLAEELRHENPLYTAPEEYSATADVKGLQSVLVGDARTPLLVLLGAVGLVLLIACVNLANLMLLRTVGRTRELAVRVALGGRRRHLARHLISETFLLTVAGGGIGVLLAGVSHDLLLARLPVDLSGVAQVGIDLRVLGFASALTALTALIAAGIPALRHSDLSPGRVLGARAVGDGGRPQRLARGLVVAEFALAVALLVAAGLLIQSFWQLRAVDPGFRAEQVVTARLDPAPGVYVEPARQLDFYDRLLDGLGGRAGVEAIGAANHLPLSGEAWLGSFAVQGYDHPPGDLPLAYPSVVTPAYFAAMGIPTVDGRVFSSADRQDGRPVAVISQSLADRFWPEGDAVGGHITFPWTEHWIEVVGVVGEVPQEVLTSRGDLAIYLPFAQSPQSAMTLVIRSTGERAGLVAGLRQTVADIDPNVPVSDVRTADQLVHASVATPRVTMLLLLALAGIALFLGAIGVYGLLAYSVGRRVGEIGLRMTLGARPAQAAGRVIGESARLAGAGIAIGLLGAYLGSRALAGLLFQVSPTDLRTFAAVPVALLVVALLSAWLPARRAARVDPMVALRGD